MMLTHVFFDIGGVLGTNGWDRGQRAGTAARFALGPEFETLHQRTVADWESGLITWDAYLDITVFNAPRPFSREELRAWVLALSAPYPESIALVERLAAQGSRRLFTLNNEPEELNVHRIERFGLRPYFSGFLSSCWLGLRKPSEKIYQRALAIAQADPAASLFIDDREENLAPARALGMRTLLFEGAPRLESALRSERLL
ncbi:MAG TPA: HAD family phosphatase [Patescibacteria group bacterium]|nr:HAD family phosphatase [Patescibacteria group bacterium]